MDNATFHKSKLTQQLIENAGCKPLFLTPYSPNLNPIEHFWFAIKHNIRKILPNYWPNIKKSSCLFLSLCSYKKVFLYV
ncbi:transposase [Spiroplasma ixodetis]|uniref:transposase n=1 Tax=Spiroplasma ixodetis TaxID=2141 RepID=UPI0033423A66